MKIAILGTSGAGKSTLAKQLADKYQLPLLHLDSVHFKPNWVEREVEDEARIVKDFLDSHDSWVIEGQYSKLHFKRRLDEADQIYVVLAPRLVRLWRVFKRSRKYRGQSRPDMAAGCNEKLDFEFVRWVIWDGCKPARIKRYRDIAAQYPDKTAWISWNH